MPTPRSCSPAGRSASSRPVPADAPTLLSGQDIRVEFETVERLVPQAQLRRRARRHARAPARRDAGHRRRIGLGQDDARHGAAGVAADCRRPHRDGCDAHRRRRPHDAARDAPAHAGGVPGSVRVAQPAHDGRPDRRRRPGAAPARADHGAARAARAGHAGRSGAERGRGPVRRVAALPARVLGRAAPAHRDRARRGAAARGAGARRADFGARRVGAAAGARAAGGNCSSATA